MMAMMSNTDVELTQYFQFAAFKAVLLRRYLLKENMKWQSVILNWKLGKKIAKKFGILWIV